MHLKPIPTNHRLPDGVRPSMPNPWERRALSGELTEARDVVWRREIVWACMDAEKLRAYIAWPGTQATVRKVAQKRLDALGRGYTTRRRMWKGLPL